MGAVWDMSDDQLESLATRPMIERGLAPWAAWESETTGFGAGFRRLAHYPKWFPLFFSSDHYVDPLIALRSNEIESGFGLYLTWNRDKADLLRDQGVTALHCRHPWTYLNINWKPTHNIQPRTLVFWNHSDFSHKQATQPDALISRLRELPSFYGKITICLHSRDIQLGLHKVLRPFKIPLTTAGDVTSKKFPYRFFEVLSHFTSAAGPTVGSHAYYVLATGRPYRLVGEDLYGYQVLDESGAWRMASAGELRDKFKRDYNTDSLFNKVMEFRKSLTENLKEPTQGQLAFARLNMGIDSTSLDDELRKRIWTQIFRNNRHIFPLYSKSLRLGKFFTRT